MCHDRERSILYREPCRQSRVNQMPEITPTQAEQDRRREAWQHANASVLIEGGVVDDETRAMQERHIRGEITKEEYRAWIFESIAADRKASHNKS